MKRISILIISILISTVSLHSQSWFLEEEFQNMEDWEALTFPKIEEHSSYAIKQEGGGTILHATSQSSASGLIYKETFDVYEFPVLSWKWKIDGIVENGDGRRKKGDDYPIRIYVIFEYDPDKASGFQQLQYNLAKLAYGEFPPDSGLNYVWANQAWDKDFIPNPFTDKAMMIPMDIGTADVGTWREHRVNILEDYRRVFEKDPPAVASLAIMADSDNSQGSSSSYIDFIRVGK